MEIMHRLAIRYGAILALFGALLCDRCGAAPDVLVSSLFTDNVLRFEGATGAPLGTFASAIDGPEGLTFGPDGNLYVSGFNSNVVARFNGTTGTFINNFASGGGL